MARGPTVDHRQSRLVQKPKAAVFKKPDSEDGEREEHDEDEKVCAVLSVALLGDSLRCDVVHGVALRQAAANQQHKGAQQ